ncbi:MAG: metal-dependent phosphohydrolase [Armatimonadota bacterium]
MSLLQRFRKESDEHKQRLPKVLHAMEVLFIEQRCFDVDRDRDLDWEYEHMNDSVKYGRILAKHRNLSADLAACAVALQNIGRISTGKSEGHAESGYEPAKSFLAALKCFTQHEIEQIASAVKNHSRKDHVDAPLDELSKDVDIYVRYIHGDEFKMDHEHRRLSAILLEFRKKAKA